MLFRYALLALPLSFMGLPLYLHLPKFYHDYYGASLSILGVLLFFLRIFDALLDPLLGSIAHKFADKKYLLGLALICFFNAFFYLPANTGKTLVLMWFTVVTFLSYLAFSIIYINYYHLGLSLSAKNSSSKIASGREFIGLLGMIVAAILPSLLSNYYTLGVAFKIYGVIFGALMLLAVFLLPSPTQILPAREKKPFITDLKFIWQTPILRKLIMIFFLNSLPMAITANVFSFYVELTLARKADTGLFLFCYLVAASVGACSLFGSNINKTKLLRKFLLMSALSFAGAFFIKAENSQLFYVICALSGFALGAEMVILSAMAVDILAPYASYSTIFFGILSSCSKMSLAIAAGVFLPLISASGYLLPEIAIADKILFLYLLTPLILKILVINLLKENLIEKTI